MKFIIVLFFGLILAISTVQAQNTQGYSRVKINADAAGLAALSNLGVAVDHGFTKEESYFISDFSEQEIQIMQAHNFNIEILIPDVVAYYEQLLANPSTEPATHNATCGGGGAGATNPYVNPSTPSHFNLGTMGGYLKYNEMLAELDEMAATYPNLITVKAPISNYFTHENRPIYYVRLSDNPN
ncbi:MAG: hypothetical protein EBV19_10575, partial [Flavobacteriia bacterium]|nr:hypothetical protein [Flavobacteriia bacterium]